MKIKRNECVAKRNEVSAKKDNFINKRNKCGRKSDVKDDIFPTRAGQAVAKSKWTHQAPYNNAANRIVDKVMIDHSLHSVLICDFYTVWFPLDCRRAAKQFRVHVRYSKCAAVHIQRAVPCYGKPYNKRSGVDMDIFHKGSEAPPPYFRKLRSQWGQFHFGDQKCKKINFPKTPKMAIFNINILGKVPKGTHNPLFYQKFNNFWGTKMCLKVMD